ncbi:hypothetical protein [Streptococcus suis]|uniref:hypothetical protein n=1 Tax=Streptococcus suis TaxID=1307 RepID=UPI000CF5AA66|nr:hypothetical protein [Streptococcus suis]
MYMIKIEMFTKRMKKKNLTYACAELDGVKLEIDLENLYITLGSDTFVLSRIPGTKGGYRYFFLCLDCGRRCRKLYKRYLSYACGNCQQVHKQTLNRTKTDCQYYWELALKEARKVEPDWTPKQGRYIFDSFPSRPKRMKRTKYWRHYNRFLKYCDKGDRLWIK